MMEIASFLNDYYADVVRRTDRFLATRGARSRDYAIGWQSIPTEPLVVVHYDDSRFDDGDYHARIMINGSANAIQIDAGFRMALGILRSIFDQPSNVAAVRDLASSGLIRMADEADSTDTSSRTYSSGLLIEDSESPARLVNIETKGERWILAKSTSRAALQYVIGAMDYQARERVGQRFAALDNS